MLNHSLIHKQQGVILIVSLVMLILLTLIGLSSMRVTSMEEKMSGNIMSSNSAYQAAETSLREGEAWVESQQVEFIPNGALLWDTDTNLIDPTTENGIPWWLEAPRDEAWWTANAQAFTYPNSPAPQTTGVDNYPQPQSARVIEFKYEDKGSDLGSGNGTPKDITFVYEVTARGTDASGQAKAMVQSITRKKY